MKLTWHDMTYRVHLATLVSPTVHMKLSWHDMTYRVHLATLVSPTVHMKLTWHDTQPVNIFCNPPWGISRFPYKCSHSIVFQHFMEPEGFITAFTRALHLSLSWARPIQSISPFHLTKIHLNIIHPPSSWSWLTYTHSSSPPFKLHVPPISSSSMAQLKLRNASIGLRTHDPSFRVEEGITCLRQRGQCAQQVYITQILPCLFQLNFDLLQCL
jgi:hypothetical protein